MVLSAFFSSAETAYISLTPGDIRAMVEKNGRKGLRVKKLTAHYDVLLATLLLGNNLANLGASALVTTITIRLFGSSYIAYATGILTLAVLVFCEIVPKQLAMAKNEPLCLVSAPVILVISWIFFPIIWCAGIISRKVAIIVVGRANKPLSLEKLLHHVKAAETEGIVETFEKEMIRNVLRINDIPVEAIMTHRTELVTFEEETSIQNALNELLKTGYTRAPILQGNSEHVSGVVTLAGLAAEIRKSPELSVKCIAESPDFVPGTLKVHELFFRLKKEPLQFAVVLDEYGGLDGVVTHKDIMEEIFGELYDEEKNQSVDEPILPDGKGGWIIRGDADFYVVNDTLGLKLEHDSRTHTIGGYLFEKLGYIPAAGVEIELSEGLYIVLTTVNKRIRSVYFRPAETLSLNK